MQTFTIKKKYLSKESVECICSKLNCLYSHQKYNKALKKDIRRFAMISAYLTTTKHLRAHMSLKRIKTETLELTIELIKESGAQYYQERESHAGFKEAMDEVSKTLNNMTIKTIPL